MDAVLGVSMTPSTVGVVLVEGQEADGATVHHEIVDIRELEPCGADEICAHLAAVVARVEAIASARGHRLHSIGVTWTDECEAEAAKLLTALAEAGSADVVPIRFPQATDTLARGIADVVGFSTTVVCVIEPEAVLALTASPGGGPVRTAITHGIDTVRGLTDWLGRQFAATKRRPDALVVVGSAVDFDAVMPKLEAALGVPVFTPAESGVALARGAALASVRGARFMFTEPGRLRRHWTTAEVAPAALLVVGVVTFVGSLSLAIGHQLSPRQESGTESRRVVHESATPAAVHDQPPPIEIPQAPTPEAVPEPTAEQVTAEPPVYDPPAPEFVTEPAADPAEVATLPPAGMPPVGAPPLVASAPEQRPSLLTRIRNRLRSARAVTDQQAPAGINPPPPELVPAPVPPPVP